jgi:hypothetical protein
MNNIQLFLIIFFVQKIFLKNYFLIITDGYIVGHNPSVYSRGKGNNLLHMPLQHCYIIDEIISSVFYRGLNDITDEQLSFVNLSVKMLPTEC